MRLFDLSLRHKIPLWGSVLVLASTLAISTALMFRAYDDLKQDMLTSSASLGQTLAKTLFPTLLHDDLWRAFEIVKAPFHAGATRNPLEAEAIFVLNPDLKILVSSDPKRMPTLSDLDDIGADHRQLGNLLRETPLETTRAFDFAGSHHFYVATPIADGGRQIGILVVSHGKEVFRKRFLDLAGHGALIGLLVVAVILPINWYWGRRTAEPLVELAKGMRALVSGQPVRLDPQLYTYRDELGQLFNAYTAAAAAIHEKALLERTVLQSERLAAIGRLAAGIAHEVNNPLGGMLMALDNFKQRGTVEPAVAKTAALLERGLQQVAATVGALLVEARASSRPLNGQDFDDVHTLLEPEIRKKRIEFDWHIDVRDTVPLPSGSVRQILINLMLNAIQATEPGGRIRLTASMPDGVLALLVANTGAPLPGPVREHLFEPFVSGREGGHGLGLWVTYQTVTQLGGQIAATWQDGEVQFSVTLPMEGTPA